MRFDKPLALFALLCAAPVFATEPPAARLVDPPAARIGAARDAAADAKAACVSVWAAPNAAGQQFGGSGVVIACEGDRSVVVTNNHVFSEQPHPDGGFRDDVYPLPATVKAGGKEYRATALGADRDADIAVVLVEGALAPAAVATAAPPVGATVWRAGIGSGYQTGTVTAPENGLTRFSITVRGRSESGDSGAGYFNEANELVGVHCGQDGRGRPRGTSVAHVRAVVAARAPVRLFPRLRARLGAAPNDPPAYLPAGRPGPAAAKSARAGCVCGDACACKAGDCPAKCPVSGPAPRLTINGVPHEKRADGYYWPLTAPAADACPGGRCALPAGSPQTFAAPAAPGCSGGNCPAPTRRGLFGR